MTTRRISGKDFEERLRTRLGTWCDIAHDTNMDHQYKIDFTITRFRDTFFTNPIGIQVTLKDDDVRKQSEFLRIHRPGKVVPKSVFIEIAPQADLDGAATVAYIALGNLTFSKQYQDRDSKVIGIRIDSDLSYEFFELEENTRNLRSAASSRRAMPIEPRNTLAGEVNRYNVEKGYGFITCTNRDENFYFHISEVGDGLEDKLLELADNQHGFVEYYPPIPVTFVDGGYRAGYGNPQARFVRAG